MGNSVETGTFIMREFVPQGDKTILLYFVVLVLVIYRYWVRCTEI